MTDHGQATGLNKPIGKKKFLLIVLLTAGIPALLIVGGMMWAGNELTETTSCALPGCDRDGAGWDHLTENGTRWPSYCGQYSVDWPFVKKSDLPLRSYCSEEHCALGLEQMKKDWQD